MENKTNINASAENVLKITSNKMVEIPINQPRTTEEIIESIIEYFKDNEDKFNEALEELDSWNGYLDDDRIYDMYELNDLVGDLPFSEALEKIDTSNFDLCDDYFKYTIWGIQSLSEKDYSDYLDEYIIEDFESNREHIYTIDDTAELSELFDELEEAREREREEEEEKNESEYLQTHGAKSIKLLPGEPAEVCYLKSELKALQNAVSDHGEPSLIEYSFPFRDSDNMILGNEEAKLINMEPNRIINGELYCGPIYIVRDDNHGNLTSLSEEDINKYLEMFKDSTPPSDEDIRNQMQQARQAFEWFNKF